MAAATFGSIQIAERGTHCGQLCNTRHAPTACPAPFDAGPVDAQRERKRVLPLSQFRRAVRQTRARPDELVVGGAYADPARQQPSSFVKLGAREYLVISICMVAFGRGPTTIADRLSAIAMARAFARRTAADTLEDALRGCALGDRAKPDDGLI